MSSADVVVDAPPLPEAIDDARAVTSPELTSSGVHLDRWQARCAPEGCDRQWVTACWSTPVGTWSSEVAELANGKLDEVARSTAVRAGGDGAMSLRDARMVGDVAVHDLEGDGRDARTFLAFTNDPSVLHACFALALGPKGNASGRDWVQHARISGAVVPPPSTSWALASLSACVHHPKETFAVAVSLVVALAFLAIVRRPGRRRARP